QTYTQAVEQHDVVDDVVEVRVRDGFAGQQHHEGPLAVRVDIGRGVAEPLDVVGHAAVPWENASVEIMVAVHQGPGAGGAISLKRRQDICVHRPIRRESKVTTGSDNFIAVTTPEAAVDRLALLYQQAVEALSKS